MLVTEVACPGLADAIESADMDATTDAIAAAAALTPAAAKAVVLGCTQYELAMDRIRSVMPKVRLHGSAPAVAAQAIRRTTTRPTPRADTPAEDSPAGGDPGAPDVHVLLSGAPGELPAAALRYAEGRLLAGLRLRSTLA